MSRGRTTLMAVVLGAAAAAPAPALAAGSPSVSTGGADQITENAARLKGTVNPNGSSTSYRFEWGLTSSYGVSGTAKSAGSRTKTLSVALPATGLIPGTVYHYRLEATNRYGETIGNDHVFRTAGNPPPDVATGPAQSVAQSTATLTGVINPHGEVTNWVFQYGLTTAYGVQTFGSSVPAGSAATTVSEQLAGLQSGATFHYRIVGYHGSIPVTGADGTFITEPDNPPVPGLSVSVTPRRERRAPYTFTETGVLQPSARFPASLSCNGTVTVLVFLARQRLLKTAVPLGSDCGYTATETLRRVPGLTKRRRRERLRIVVHFDGNGYVAPHGAGEQHVTVGPAA